MARQPGIQQLLIARTASKLGLATLSYGGMVFLARQGASEIQIVLVGASGYIAALLFGLQGGVLADIMPKRIALAFGLGLQAILCFAIPAFWGTTILPLVALIFLISTISQLTSPAMKSAVRLVTTTARIASVSALISLAGSIGSAIGSSFLAPILIRQWGVSVVMYVTGGMLILAAIKAVSLPKDPKRRKDEPRIRLRDGVMSPRKVGSWMLGHPAIASMVLVGALVVALYESINSLLPVYVREVLNVDPTLSVYIFAPAAIGFLLGTLAGPFLIFVIGERWLTVFSMLAIAVSTVLYGTVDHVASSLAPWSPLGLLNHLHQFNLPDNVLAAGLIAIPMNLGSTMAGSAVQAFISKVVPIAEQGRTFGVQEVIEQAITVASLLLLGGIGTLTGTRIVFLVAPLVIIAIGTFFIRFSYRSTGSLPPGRGQASRQLILGRGIATTPDAPVAPVADRKRHS
jgi:MFS family permease